MKKLLTLGAIALTMCCCSKDDINLVPEEVYVKLNYTLLESGNLSRAGSDVYNSFYNDYIKNKKLTPKTYSLTFTNTESGATASVSGLWQSNDAIRLVEGTYLVTGSSAPVEIERAGMPSDTVYLSFNENVNISKDMTSLILNAKYDSFLLLFDQGNCQEILYQNSMELAGGSYQQIKKNLNLTGNLYTLFVRDFAYGVYDDDAGHYIKIKRDDGGSVSIELDKIPFEKGKYYYFNNMTNSFDIPAMESGN